MSDLILPQHRASIIGRNDIEAPLRAAIGEGALTNGWLIVGPKGSGKASIAYRIARALLEPSSLAPGDDLSMANDSRVYRLIASGAHPDLFIAERRYDEKTQRYETEITVDTIRKLTGFLNRTASMGGWRVAIIDTADEMNRNASNALLKALEEPPARATLLLLSAQPGRLLATIRSRCRRIDLRPVESDVISSLLQNEANLSSEDATRLAHASQGRPGYALALAAGEGREAIVAAGDFLNASVRNGDASSVINRLTGKAAAERWELFLPFLLETISEAARRTAKGENAIPPFEGANAAALVAAHRELAALAGRGDALNLDRAQLILAMGRTLHRALRAQAA